MGAVFIYLYVIFDDVLNQYISEEYIKSLMEPLTLLYTLFRLLVSSTLSKLATSDIAVNLAVHEFNDLTEQMEAGSKGDFEEVLTEMRSLRGEPPISQKKTAVMMAGAGSTTNPLDGGSAADSVDSVPAAKGMDGERSGTGTTGAEVEAAKVQAEGAGAETEEADSAAEETEAEEMDSEAEETTVGNFTIMEGENVRIWCSCVGLLLQGTHGRKQRLCFG
jgi:hypothetical protein